MALSPINIDDIHENDTSVTGFSPVPNVALTVKINGVAGVSTANSNASGRFAIVLAQKAQVGNFVEVSGVAPNKTPIYGSATVLAAGAQTGAAAQTTGAAAKAVKLSKPSVAVAHDGDKSLTVTQNSADASQSGLSIHVKVLSPTSPTTSIWEGDCSPDAKTGSCSVTPNPPMLASGQVIEVTETLVSGGKTNTSDVVTTTVAAAQGLATPTVTGTEGSAIVSAAPDKADAGRSGLYIDVRVVDAGLAPVDGLTGRCAPDSAGDKCSIALSQRLKGTWKLQASEALGSARSSQIVADVTPLAALGKPTISPPHEGDKSVTVTLNSNDASAIKPPVQLNLRVSILRGGALPEVMECTPNDSINQCKVTLSGALLDGQVVNAQEVIDDGGPRSSDDIAVATVVKDDLGLPTIAKVRETDTSANVMLNPADFMKWAGKLSIAVDVYDGTNPLPGQSTTCSPADNTKNFCTVTFTALGAGQTIHAKEIPSATAGGTPSKPGPESVAEVQELGYNWGRVRAYFSVGAVFSRSNITTSSTTHAPTVAASNFTSPDAFVAFDMDFNWFTKQGCLAAAFVSTPVRLGTLADAVHQCDLKVGKRDTANRTQRDVNAKNTATSQAAALIQDIARADLDPSVQAARPKIDAGLSKTSTPAVAIKYALGTSSDTSVASVLEFLDRLYSHAGDREIPERIAVIVGKLQVCGSSDADCQRSQKQTLRDLISIELTSNEAQQTLTLTDGFEKRQRWGFLLNSYFQSRLTQTAASNGFALTSSPNSVHVEGGIYAPFYFHWSRWTYQHQPYAMFFAPIAKLGFDSLRGSATDQLLQASPSSPNPTPGQANFENAATALSRDVYRMMAFGGRLGFFGFSPTPNRAPELVSYIDFTYGRFDNYFTQRYNDSTGAVRFPWRFDMTGILKIPTTPLYVGTDLNKGVGPDNLSIFVGLRTDLSSLLSKLIPSIK